MNVDWKEFFLTNLEELWAPHSDAHTDGSSKLGATSTRTPDIVQRQPQVKTTISKNASRSSDGASSPDPPFPASRTRIYGNRPRILPLPASHKKQKQAYGTRPHGAGASSSAETPRLSSSVGSASTHASSSRKRRGAPVEDYHDSTYIPVLSDNVKPAPPHRDAPGLFSRFTDDDKVFFIQYLRWRLHERPFPTKHELYDELAAQVDLHTVLLRCHHAVLTSRFLVQTPHHNAKAWKKHWADFSELPDKVYIAARQREDRERDASSSSEAKSTPGVSGSERNGDTSELSSIPSPPSKARSGEPVTEADLRRMAQYTVEKNAVWKAEGTRLVARWKEFSERPENRKRRSHDGWWSAARDHSDGQYLLAFFVCLTWSSSLRLVLVDRVARTRRVRAGNQGRDRVDQCVVG
ncbi:hypothetical protein C8Q80DRAFT_1153805 [Daedaleopsis nitida]|nr:hypothetical protein C8Q80DRAFT_1153805 [Daedaleopsis nitida]